MTRIIRWRVSSRYDGGHNPLQHKPFLQLQWLDGSSLRLLPPQPITSQGPLRAQLPASSFFAN